MAGFRYAPPRDGALVGGFLMTLLKDVRRERYCRRETLSCPEDRRLAILDQLGHLEAQVQR